MALELSVSALLGYLIGNIIPAALLDKIKKAGLRKKGTRNLGATNTLLVLGKRWGVLVMLFDILKAAFSVWLARWIFPVVPLTGMVSGTCAMLGHVFPFYMGFRGGKGLAAFGGLVLAIDWRLFLLLLGVDALLVLASNMWVVTPFFAGIFFPLLYGLFAKDLWGALVAAVAGAVLMYKNVDGLRRALRGEDKSVRQTLFKKKEKKPKE